MHKLMFRQESSEGRGKNSWCILRLGGKAAYCSDTGFAKRVWDRCPHSKPTLTTAVETLQALFPVSSSLLERQTALSHLYPEAFLPCCAH